MDLVERYRVTSGKSFSLSHIDPNDTGGDGLTKTSAKSMMDQDLEELVHFQERLYAQHRWSLLIILQGMDTSGKDGVVKHVMTGVNPLGCAAHSFKAPTAPEMDRGWLWRSQVAVPPRGHIGIFNRSYYEDVLAVRVRKDGLEQTGLPPALVNEQVWDRRFADINAFEAYLASIGIIPLKFMLHISKDEQRERLLARADDSEKRWKFNAGDVADRQQWSEYQAAYQDAIRHTATKTAPWHVVPADHKWFARLVVAAVVVDALRRIDPQFPVPCPAQAKSLESARASLLTQGEP